jgi:hypothetical protein
VTPTPQSPASRTSSRVNHFATALSRAPALKVVQAELPAVWNTALLEISTNISLEAIQLSPSPPIAGAHIFLAEARKHPRLAQLIANGTPIPALSVPLVRPGRSATRVETCPDIHGKYAPMQGRLRAHTTVAATSSSTPSTSRCPVSYPAASSSGAYASGSSKTVSLEVPVERAVKPSVLRFEERVPPNATSRREAKTNRRLSAV